MYVYEGLSGTISQGEYENNQDTTWQINSDCESLLLESTKFITESTDILRIDEEGRMLREHSGQDKLVHTTYSGTLTLNFQSDDGYIQSFKKLIFNRTSSF